MEFEEYFEKFEKLQRWIISDLKDSTVLAHANFLVAQGIFNYVEILGSFCTDKNSNRLRDRFDFVFKNLLIPEYWEVFCRIESLTNNGAYNAIRCGLTHEYLIKTYTARYQEIEIDFSIFGIEDEAGYSRAVDNHECGIELIEVSAAKYHLNIHNPRIINDLNLAFESLKKKIIAEPLFRQRFLERSKEIRLDKLN